MPRRPQSAGNMNRPDFSFGQRPSPPREMWRGGRVEQNGKAPAEPMTPKQALIKKRAAKRSTPPKNITGGPAFRNPGQGIINTVPKGKKKKRNGEKND